MLNASEVGLRIHPDAYKVIPGIVWWDGFVSCSICGYGAEGHARPVAVHVAPIPEGQSEPFPLECPACRNMSLSPCEGPHR